MVLGSAALMKMLLAGILKASLDSWTPLLTLNKKISEVQARLEDGLDVDPEASEDVADKEELARSFDCGYEFGFNGREGHTPLELRAPAD